jgi:hypothetical protein
MSFTEDTSKTKGLVEVPQFFKNFGFDEESVAGLIRILTIGADRQPLTNSNSDKEQTE